MDEHVSRSAANTTIVITMKLAKERGLKRYFTGKPCYKGHVSARLVSDCACIECKKVYHKNNPECNRKAQRKYWKTEAYKVVHRRRVKEWREQNPEKVKLYEYKRNRTLLRRIKSGLRGRLYQALRGEYRSGRAIYDLGCSISDFKDYIESQFTEGMTWDNWGLTWHIDHRVPLCEFDLLLPIHLKDACHYSNLQPLRIDDHKKKTTLEVQRLMVSRTVCWRVLSI